MKLNKEDFLNSELGSNLLECIESWDWALRGGVIISLEQTNVLEFAQKTKKIGL